MNGEAAFTNFKFYAKMIGVDVQQNEDYFKNGGWDIYGHEYIITLDNAPLRHHRRELMDEIDTWLWGCHTAIIRNPSYWYLIRTAWLEFSKSSAAALKLYKTAYTHQLKHNGRTNRRHSEVK